MKLGLLLALTLAAPAMAQHSWMTDKDYPREALSKGEQGTVEVQFDLSKEGRVANCVVIASSGSPSLDAATCKTVQQIARMKPARDEQGRRIASVGHRKVVWTLPRK